MGGSESKNTTEVINDTVQRVIFETIQGCKGPISQEQIFEVNNTRNAMISGVTMEQYASINMNCISQTMSQTDFANKMDTALKQMADSETSGLGFGSADSENVGKITNKLTQEVQNKMTQDCTISVLQGQGFKIKNSQNVVIENIKMIQSAQGFMDCLQTSQNYTKNVNDLATVIDQGATAKRKGLLDIGLDFGLGGSISGVSISSSICICCIIIAIFVLPMIMGMAKGSGSSGSRGSSRSRSSRS